VTLSGLERLLPQPVGGPEPTEPASRSAGSDGAWQRHEVAVAERVRAFAEARPDNLLWGSDWPHVGLEMTAPAAEETIARLERWLPDEGLRRQVLVDNAVRRYDFTPDGDQE
jgi:predicted TIM-barrel fold metal-dependent hydrolase